MTVPSNDVMFQSWRALSDVVLSVAPAETAAASTAVVLVGAIHVRLDGCAGPVVGEPLIESLLVESLLVESLVGESLVGESLVGELVVGWPVVDEATGGSVVGGALIVGVPVAGVPTAAGLGEVGDPADATPVGTVDAVFAPLHAVPPASRSAAKAAERARRAIIRPTLCVRRSLPPAR